MSSICKYAEIVISINKFRTNILTNHNLVVDEPAKKVISKYISAMEIKLHSNGCGAAHCMKSPHADLYCRIDEVNEVTTDLKMKDSSSLYAADIHTINDRITKIINMAIRDHENSFKK